MFKKTPGPDKTEEELRQARHADPKADCPLWQAPCKEHGCRWYKYIRGTCPNTGADVDRWDCAIAWWPMLMIENSQQQRQTGASCDKVATEIKKFHDGMARQNAVMHNLLAAPVKAEDQ